jgi:hypothetical protein
MAVEIDWSGVEVETHTHNVYPAYTNKNKLRIGPKETDQRTLAEWKKTL